MATIPCNYCDENPAVMLVNNLETGDTDAICANDFPGWVLGLAEAVTASVEPPPEEQPKKSGKRATKAAGRTSSESSEAPTDTGDDEAVPTESEPVTTASE